jgi:hypothetical protein
MTFPSIGLSGLPPSGDGLSDGAFRIRPHLRNSCAAESRHSALKAETPWRDRFLQIYMELLINDLYGFIYAASRGQRHGGGCFRKGSGSSFSGYWY